MRNGRSHIKLHPWESSGIFSPMRPYLLSFPSRLVSVVECGNRLYPFLIISFSSTLNINHSVLHHSFAFMRPSKRVTISLIPQANMHSFPCFPEIKWLFPHNYIFLVPLFPEIKYCVPLFAQNTPYFPKVAFSSAHCIGNYGLLP